MTRSRVLLVVVALVACCPCEAQEPPTTDDGFPLPPGAVRRFGNRQMRHPEGIINVAVSPDGKLLATAGFNTVVVWDLQTLKARQSFCVPVSCFAEPPVRGSGLAFLADSKSLVVCVRPNQGGPFVVGSRVDLAQVWDVETGKKKFALGGAQDYLATCWSAAGGKEIVVYANAGSGAEFRSFAAADGKELRTVAAPQLENPPWVGPGGNVVLVESRDGSKATVLDATTGKEAFSLPEPIAEVAFSRDGKLLVWVDKGGTVHVHDLPGKKEKLTFVHPEKSKPGPMVVSADNKTLYFTSSHGRLFRWDLEKNAKGPDFGNRHNFWNLTGIVLSPDETVLYSVSQDHLIKRWDVKTGKELPLPDGYTTHVSMVVAADGKHLILTDHEGQVDYWDLVTGKRVKQLQKSQLGGINCLAESADGKWLAGGRTSSDIRLFDLSTAAVVSDISLFGKPGVRWDNDPVQQVTFAPDGRVVYGMSSQTGLTAWEVPGGKRVWKTPRAGPLLAVDPKGRWLATGTSSSGDRIKRWHLHDVKTGQEIARTVVEMVDVEINGQRHRVEPFLADLVWLPDGSRLLSLHYGGTVRIWDPDTRAEVGRLALGRLGQLSGRLACSPDGRWVAVGSERTVTVWDLATRTRVLDLVGHDSSVQEVAFTKDGRGLVSNADLSPILWDLCPKDLPANRLWESLASEDGAKAYKAQWALIRNPAAAVKLFGEQIKPAELAIKREQFDRWVVDLDSPQFRVRETAEKELTTAGGKVSIGWLRKALADSKADEPRARLARVLAMREKDADPNAWRLSRAVQVLELAGTDETRALLKTWAAIEGRPLADDAKGALGRLK